MLDYCIVFEKGGLILYEKIFMKQQSKRELRQKLEKFISSVFLAQKESKDKKFKIDSSIFQYKQDTNNDIVFVLVYSELIGNIDFSQFMNDFSQIITKKYIRTLKKKNQNFCNFVQYQEQVNKDLTTLLKITNFDTNNDKTRKVKKWEKKSQKKEKQENSNQGRKWDPALTSQSQNIKAFEKNMNYSKDASEQEKLELFKKKFMPDDKDNSFVLVSSDEEEEGGFFSKMQNKFQELKKGQKIDESKLNEILNFFKGQLIQKNVAEDIARQICDNLRQKLKEEKTNIFENTKNIVRKALKESLTKILTPKRNIDLLNLAHKSKEQGRPFVIIFIGVNGVGKSTTLSKVAYMLKNNGFSVLLAACDNFRSGAVEQLQTHGRCLGIPVYQRGYKGKPAQLAKEAVREANQKKIDVVLIDTAGRMQDNEPLMQELANMVNVNNPDVILFIGEALTGNDGVDQLMKFNKALKDLSSSLSDTKQGREIDGVLLTKFDTVDDKVGATLSLTYSTGKPILFVGVGQKYNHLKKLRVESVVKKLLN